MHRPDRIIDDVFRLEGVYSDHEKDPGGTTYYGISKNYWPEYYEEWGGKPTRAQARDFYDKEFVYPLRLSEVADDRVATEVLECAVNMGRHRAVKIAQFACNLALQESRLRVDGIMGPNTIGALNGLNHRDTLRWLKLANYLQLSAYVERTAQMPKVQDFIDSLGFEPDRDQTTFFRGWLRRIGFGDG